MPQHQYRYPSLEELLDKLDLDYTGSHMDCPYCDGKKTIKLKYADSVWNCAKCKTGGGIKHLYAFIREGIHPKDYPTDTRSRAALSKRLQDFMGFDADYSPSQNQATVKRKKPEKVQVPPAADEQLDMVYRAIAAVPELRLLPQHKELLLNRGLSGETIERNGYRSIPESVPVPQLYHDMYLHNGGKYPSSRKADSIRLGLYIADTLVQQGMNLKGVPGFYKFGIHWCFWCIPGILIPTRNINGQIVIWQVRKDQIRSKNEAKYLTVSCQDLPGAVTEAVSRCHFPIGNAPLDSDAPLLVTEGPLKADVACHLYGKPVTFAAIPGINTTTDLLSLCPLFLEKGQKKIYNALDMDRLTNKNVRNGSQELAKKFRAHGIVLEDMYWGNHYATTKYMQLSLLTRKHGLQVTEPSNANIFQRVDFHAAALDNAGIAHSLVNGEKYHWEPSTKGIDDYLFSTKFK